MYVIKYIQLTLISHTTLYIYLLISTEIKKKWAINCTIAHFIKPFYIRLENQRNTVRKLTMNYPKIQAFNL